MSKFALQLQVSSFFGILLILLISGLAAQTIDPIIKNNIDNFILNNFLPSNHNPAISIAVTDGNGSLLYSSGYGFMDVENQLPTTNETLYLVGSISKGFTAVIVAKTLHEKFPGKDDVLDTPVRKLIPEFNFTLNDRFRSEHVTFRDMLSHRVCSKSYGIATLAAPYNSSEEITFRQRYAKEECGFRTSFVYNNGMFALASEVIAAIAGRPYKTLLLELLNELGMSGSTFVKEDDADYVTGRAVPYYLKDGERQKYNPQLLKRVTHGTSAGGMVSNAVDMAKYLQFHLSKGKVGERQVVPENVMNWLYEPAIHRRINENRYKPDLNRINYAYGLGFHLASNDGWQEVRHSGSLPPFLCHLSFHPGLNIGVFSATNQQPLNETLEHIQLQNAILDILRNNTPSIRPKSDVPTSDMKSESDQLRLVRTLQEDQLQNYTGSYGSGLQGELEILLAYRNETNSTELYMDYGEWFQAYLLQTETESKFLVQWDSDIIQDIYTLELSDNTFCVFNGNITTMEIIDGGETVASFEKGVSLDNLPVVPWTTDSCRPEEN